MSQEQWIFKYEPKTIDEMIVTDEKREKLKKIMSDLPNTLIGGKPGTGKGTFMNILLRETGCSFLKINGSMDNGIDVIRDRVHKFARAFSPNNLKIVYLNEAERISPNAEESLKDLIEAVQEITRFFFLTNNESMINDAILSRCSAQLDLNDPPVKDIAKHVLGILRKERVTITKNGLQSLGDLIKSRYPDIRKIIGTVQLNVSNGTLDSILNTTSDEIYEQIFNGVVGENGDPEEVRKLLKSNFIDYPQLYRYFYDKVILDPDIVKNPGSFIIDTGEYLYRNASVTIGEINFMAYYFNLMHKGII